MEEFKSLIANPGTYFFGFGLGALLGVWWWKLSPSTANLTVVAGVTALTVSAFFYSKSQPWLVCLAWTAGIWSVATLLAYYVLWSPTPPVTATPPASPQASNPPTLFAKIDHVFLSQDGGVPVNPRVGKGNLFAAIYLSIKNLGEPAAMSRWYGAIRLPDGREINGVRFDIDPLPGFFGMHEGAGDSLSVIPTRRLYADETIDAKTSTPMAKGAIAEGYLPLVFKGVDAASLPKGSRLWVMVEDVYGNQGIGFNNLGENPTTDFDRLPGRSPREMTANVIRPGHGDMPPLPRVGPTREPPDVSNAAVVFFLGDSVVHTSTLPITVLALDGEDMIVVENAGSAGVALSAKFFNAKGKIVCEIVRNEIHINEKNRFRVEQTAHSLAIVNDEARKVFELEFINKKAIRLLGDFYLRNGFHVVITPTDLSYPGRGFRRSAFQAEGGGKRVGLKLTTPPKKPEKSS